MLAGAPEPEKAAQLEEAFKTIVLGQKIRLTAVDPALLGEWIVTGNRVPPGRVHQRQLELRRNVSSPTATIVRSWRDSGRIQMLETVDD